MRFFIALLALLPLLSQGADVAKFPAISLNAQTNIVSDNGTALTFNGVPIGSGTILWTSYTNSDFEGGTIYGTASTNLLVPKIVDFAVNYLTNFWGGPAAIVSIGGYAGGQPDLGTLGVDNADVFSFGDNLDSTVLHESGTIFLTGYNLFSSGVTNSFGLFGNGQGNFRSFFADGANNYYATGSDNFRSSTNVNSSAANFALGRLVFYTSYQNNANNSVGIGNRVFEGARFIDTENTFGFGQLTLAGTTVLNSTHDILAIQNPALYNSKITNSFVITSLAGGVGAVLNDSKYVTFIGYRAGASVNGAYTNVVFVGDSSTLGATGQDQMVLGTNMVLSLSATTNHIVFGNTNSLPAVTNSIVKWVSVQIQGDTNAYRLPLYK